MWLWELIKPFLFYIGPFILVPVAFVGLWVVWHRYVRMYNIFHGNSWVLYEVVLPKEIFKSPQSMEVVFGAFNQTFGGTWWSKFWVGDVRTWFSLEMVSIEGRVHFYIRSLRLFKHLIESQIYAQYGDVEIREVEDYVGLVKYGKEPGWNLWGAQEKLAKPDPYPIKTYIDYGLDNMSLKEEMKTDPLTPTIEYLSSLGQGEYCFIQILAMATKDRFHVPGFLRKKQGWKDEGSELIKKLMDKKGEKIGKGKDGEIKIELGQLKLSPGEQDTIKAIERSISKLGFHCGIRMLYSAKKEHYSLAHRLAMANLFTQYTTLNLNGFKHDITTDANSVLMLWLGLAEKKEDYLRKIILDAYRLRSYFYPPYVYHPFVLNTEELATIFHFPGGVLTTGGVARIESKKAEAPPNLPM